MTTQTATPTRLPRVRPVVLVTAPEPKVHLTADDRWTLCALRLAATWRDVAPDEARPGPVCKNCAVAWTHLREAQKVRR